MQVDAPLRLPSADAPSQADRAYLAIRDLIVSLELRPGAVINERQLMERVGVGRTPTREALQRLAQERLVEVYPRRGMFVTSVDIRDLASLSEVRVVLESDAARLAAERANDADRESIEELLRELGGRKPSDQRALMDLDRRIHRHVYACTHNGFLATTLEEYYALALRIWFLALDRPVELRSAVLEHRALLEAIRDGDAKTAEQAMRSHVLDFEQAIRRVLVGGS
jgi:DNA-binding GntR family transcriptional regulator